MCGVRLRSAHIAPPHPAHSHIRINAAGENREVQLLKIEDVDEEYTDIQRDSISLFIPLILLPS